MLAFKLSPFRLTLAGLPRCGLPQISQFYRELGNQLHELKGGKHD